MDIDSTINNICNEIKSGKNKNNSDISQDQPQKAKRGRKNSGLTQLHKKEYNDKRKLEKKLLRNADNIKDFSQSPIIEKISGDIVVDDLNNFADLYILTCDSVLDDFKSNNTELIKKHPYMWYKNLLIELKKNVPAISIKDIDKMYIVWDCLKYLLNSIGLYITYEIFQDFTKIYDYQIKKYVGLSPKYADFMQKIINDKNNQLINEIAYNPYNQTNKIFLAKVNGIIEKTETKTIEVNHNIKNYDNIAAYRIQDQQQPQQ